MSQDIAATVAGLEALREWTNHSGPAYLKASFEKSLTAAIALLREQEETSAKFAAAERRLSNEYVCTCGIRVTPHRRATGRISSMSQDLAATVAGLEALREREHSKMGMRADLDELANKHIATLTAAIALLRSLAPQPGLEPRGCPTPGSCSCPSAQSAIAPSDSVCVPREPTEAMLKAASDARDVTYYLAPKHYTAIYRAMLAAAPTVPAQEPVAPAIPASATVPSFKHRHCPNEDGECYHADEPNCPALNLCPVYKSVCKGTHCNPPKVCQAAPYWPPSTEQRKLAARMEVVPIQEKKDG